MLGLTLRALAERRAQAVWIAVLTMFAVAGAAFAPWYHAAALEVVTTTDVAAAPVSQRVIVVWGRVQAASVQQSPLPDMRRKVSPLLRLPNAPTVLGEQGLVTIDSGTRVLPGLVAYRDGVCDHLHIVGACPVAADQVVVGADMASRLGVRPGDSIRLTGSGRWLPFVVVGVYRPTSLDGTYWVESGLLASPASFPAGQLTSPHGDAVFTTEEGVRRTAPQVLDLSYHVVVPSHDLTDRSDGGFAARLAASRDALARSGYQTRTTAGDLAQLIRRDRRLATAGVEATAVQVLLLGWVCLYLAVRHTATDRRQDLALLKLRGAAGWRATGLVMLQIAVPTLAGAVVGWVLAYLAGTSLVGGRTGAAVRDSLAVAGLAVVVGVAVAAAAELRALRTPVVDLLRRVPARRSRWRADLVDLLVVLLAVVGIYQAAVETGDRSPLPRLASGLMALAVGLIAARMLPIAAARGGGAALRAGRLGTALAVLSLARRPGTSRLLAVLVVAVALLSTTAMAWHASTVAAVQRAEHELGAASVLSVQASSPAQLLSVVRRVDPEGRYAMGVVRTPAVTKVGRVLAVDSPRLARVALWRDAYAANVADVARTLRPAALRSVELTDGTLVLRARVPAGDPPTTVTAVVARPDGEQVTLEFGPVAVDGRPVAVTVSGCQAESACRLVGWRCGCPTVTLSQLDGPIGTVVAPDAFGDMARWRPAASTRGFGVTVSAVGEGLTIRRSRNPAPVNPPVEPDPTVFVADSPVPLPVVVAGTKQPASRTGDDRVAVVGGDELPFRVAGTTDMLPVVGTSGALVDLESATYAAPVGGPDAAYQVWLTGDAPGSIVDGLAAGGLSVLRTATVAGTADRYARQGPAMALRYALFGAFLAVLLATGSVLVIAAGERAHRAGELTALRTQGLPVQGLRVAVYTGPVLLAAAALPVGVLACLLASGVIGTTGPVFTDGWRVLPLVTGPTVAPLVTVAAFTFLTFTFAGALGARRMLGTVVRSGADAS